MKTYRILATLFLAFIISFGLSAQTADDVINDYVSAIGGKKKLKKIKSLQWKSDMVSDMFEATAVTTVLNGKGYKMEMDVMGYQSVTCYSDTEGWRTDPMSGTKEQIPDDEYKLGKGEIYIGGGLEYYKDMGLTAELVGRKEVNGVNAYQVRIGVEGTDVYADQFFDPDTHLLIRTIVTVDAQGSEIDMVTDYKDYKKIEGGILLSHVQEIDFGGQLIMDNTINLVEIDIPVDPAIFVRE
jgi:hypothetical protein